MQRGLPVEEHDVAVLHVPLHLVAVLQVLLRVRLAQVDAQPVGAQDVPRAGQVRRPVVDELVRVRVRARVRVRVRA